MAEDAKLVQDRAHDFFRTLRPQNHFHAWLVTQISLLSIRIERCERIERRVRDKIAMAAEVSWEDERRLDAMLLGGQLGNKPDVVVEQLRKSPQGCEWLMTRWAMLAHSADVKGSWTAEQARLAFDLLGTPAEFREGQKPGASLDFEGRVVEPADDPASVARREVAALRERRELVSGLDEASRSLAESDLGADSDPDLRRLRRHESSLHSRLRWCLKQLQEQSPMSEPPRGLMAEWLGQHERTPRVEADTPPAPPLPSPKCEPVADPPRSVHPPFDLELHEIPAPGEDFDIPTILANRRRAKAEQGQARRDLRRRKLERLRA